MPSYTTSLRLIQPATGEYSGSWGTQVNNGITALVDTSVAGTASITMTAADYTLSTANGATDEARAMFLVLGGTPGAARNVICPAVSKLYYVTNNTTGGFAQTVKTSAGTGISVPNGASMVLRCDGTNVVEAQNSLGSIVLNGGTANGVAYLNASKALTTGSALVFDGTNFSTTGTATATKLIPTGGSATGNGMYLPAANTLAWSNNGAETMRLDSSGNLGLGVTPSAWWSNHRALEISTNGCAIVGQTNAPVTHITANAFQNSSLQWIYKTTYLATRYMQDATTGAHQWFTAPSGTAGNAISFTQAMTLDASGQLSVGAVLAENSTGVYLLPTGEMRVKDSTENGTSQISIYNINTTNDSEQFFVAMNSADVDIGNRRTDGGALKLFTFNTERARITSGGDLLVGTATSPSSSNAGFAVPKDADGTYLRNACTITTTRIHFEFVNGNGTVGTISTNASATAYNTSSDRRLKENIAPAADAGPVIDAIEIVQHDWKVGGHTRFGVIAQDLNAVAPEAVSAGDDGEEIEKTWGVDYSKLVPMLIKEIQSLRARVAQLESKA